MWSLWPWVSTMACTRRPSMASTIGSVVVGGVEDDHLAVVADQPDVVGDLPLAAVEGEDAVGGDQFAGHGDSTTTERSTSPRSILWKASSTSSSHDRLADELVEVEPALEVEVDQHREVARRQAVAVPRRLQRTAATEHLDERQLEHVGRGVGTPTSTTVPARSRASNACL